MKYYISPYSTLSKLMSLRYTGWKTGIGGYGDL